MFLVVIGLKSDIPRMRRIKSDNKRSPIYAATGLVAHGVNEGMKQKINNETESKKRVTSVAERVSKCRGKLRKTHSGIP